MQVADRVAVFTGGYFDSDTLTFTDVYTAGWFNEDAPPTPPPSDEGEEIMIFKPNWKTGEGVDSYEVTATAVSDRFSFASRMAARSSPMAIKVHNTHATAKLRVDLGDDTVVAKSTSIFLGPGRAEILVPSHGMTDLAYLSDGSSPLTITLGSLVAG